jgi:transglutaminase-like putative cysteine protease
LIALRIYHKTTYRYRKPVRLEPHRLILRPRESRDLRLTSSVVTTTPAATITWAHDVFGNAIATATFDAMSDHLVIDSVSELQLDATDWPVFAIAATAASYPFAYSASEWIDLGALVTPQYPDLNGRLRAWAEGFVRSRPTDTLSLLKDLSLGVSSWILYQSREDEGTQSGYLYNPARAHEVGTTHAWAEIFIPGAGWITFDPTNRSVGGSNLIPVAVARNIAQAMPVAGSFTGMTDAFQGMSVEVVVSPS